MKMSKLGKAHKHLAFPRDGDGGEGGTDDGGEGNLDLEKLMATPEMQAAIQAKLDAEVAGLKKKNSDLIAKEKVLKESAAKFEGLDVERIQALQKQIDENEEMKLLSEGKTEEVVERRVEAMRRDYEANLTARDTKITEYQDILKQKDEDLTALVVDGQVREAYTKLDFEPTAMDDIISLGRRTFIMDEKGMAIPRDEQGNLIFSKDGKTPISASEWLENLSEKKPYLRRASLGAGANGSGRGGGRDIDVSKLNNIQRISLGLANGDLD